MYIVQDFDLYDGTLSGGVPKYIFSTMSQAHKYILDHYPNYIYRRDASIILSKDINLKTFVNRKDNLLRVAIVPIDFFPKEIDDDK